MHTLEVKVEVCKLPISATTVRTLHNLDRYDLIVFTSGNARRFFAQELRKRRISIPRRARIVQVGPRNDLLKLSVRGKRILFPRSAIAPFDIVWRLRGKGAVVRVIPLYTTHGTPLSSADMKTLREKKISKLYFKSPSGVTGFLRQLRGATKRDAFGIPAHCIGATTARAARKAGFKHVSMPVA